MHRPPLHIDRRRQAVDRVAEDIEHAREDGLAHRRSERTAGVERRHAPSQTLRGCERDAAHVLRIALGEHLDDDLPVGAGLQDRIDRRQAGFEADVYDAAAHRDHDAGPVVSPAGVDGSPFIRLQDRPRVIRQLSHCAASGPRSVRWETDSSRPGAHIAAWPSVGEEAMKIKSEDYRVRAAECVDLRRRPTRVKPAYKSKKDYHDLLDEHVEQLSELQRLHYAS